MTAFLTICTGADSNHFANLRVLLGSWLRHHRRLQMLVCDYGLTELQKEEISRLENLDILVPPTPITHPWIGKSLIGKFISGRSNTIRSLMWMDADSFFNSPLPDIEPLLAGYDMLIDAHVQSIGEIVDEGNIAELKLRPDDSYFSTGCWIARKGCLLETYEQLCSKVRGKGNLWEGDAFVAAVYQEKLRIRPVNGSIWHCRGKTSLNTCRVEDGTAYHGRQPIYVVHANDSYRERDDGRRILIRQELAALQDVHEAFYLNHIGTPLAIGTRGPNAFLTGRD